MVVDKYEQYFKDHNRTKEFSGHSAKGFGFIVEKIEF